MTYQKRRRPKKPTPGEREHARRVELYEANVEAAQIAQSMGEGNGILDVDPTEFGLPEDYDDGERYFAHAMQKDD
jgi:hypothetical protein